MSTFRILNFYSRACEDTEMFLEVFVNEAPEFFNQTNIYTGKLTARDS